MWACSDIALVIPLLEDQYLVWLHRVFVVPLVHCWVGFNAHRLSDLIDPSVCTHNQVLVWDCARISAAEGVLVNSLDWTPCLGED